MVLDPNTGNDEDGDVVLGRIDDDGAFEAYTADPGLTTAVKAKAYRGGMGTYFAGLFGLSTVSAEQYAIAVSGGPSSAECPLPIAVPSCFLPEEGICGLEVRMADSGVDNAAWALPGSSNPSSSAVSSAITSCSASSATTDVLGLNNGQITTVLNTLANAVSNSTEMWDAAEFGVMPARTGNAISTTKYGHVLRRLGMVYEDPSNCTNSQFNYDGVPILGYVTMVVYDIQSTGSPKWVKMRIACDEAPETSGGGFYGTTAPPRMVYE
jgi:hypothetical protein